METQEVLKKKPVKRKIRRNVNHVPPVISVKTANGNVVTMRKIPDEEIKALRNDAYDYLA